MEFSKASLISLFLFGGALAARNTSCGARSLFLDLEPYYNNKAFGQYPGEAAFDRLNQSFQDPRFPTDKHTSSLTGVEYLFPGYTGPDGLDNVICDGQTIDVPQNEAGYFSASFLLSNDRELASISDNVTFTYTDNSTQVYELRTLAWFNTLTINRGEIIFPNRFTAKGVDWNTSHIFERTASLTPGKKLQSVTLPTTTDAERGRMHIFAISLFTGSALGVQSVRPTQKWVDDYVQIVEVILNNAGSECFAGSGLTVELEGEGFRTVKPGAVKRLCPGEQKTVQIGVLGSSNGPVDVRVVVDDGSRKRSKLFGNTEIGLLEWTHDLDNIAKHEAPDWFDESKYGIFLHWGPYAVAGWGNSTPYESYAEWYWFYSMLDPRYDRSNFQGHRLETFGETWNYDNTFEEFTAELFDPKEWVDLINDAGAKYFVITTKHHDGFALFDAGTTSNRSAVHYGPQRDLLKELFDAAEEHYPDMKRGTYFSLPEWYNPDYRPYGHDHLNKTEIPNTSAWPGGLATNPFTGEKEPYTGWIPVKDYVTDLMVPQMSILAYEYKTDIMWCDCGTANNTAEFVSGWWNSARAENRQVTMNSRCGIAQSDFDTPEYQTFSSPQAQKWESNRGMDPYSYGFNRATQDWEYMNATTIVHSLVDMVSKNGNFLLNIGPRADGTIIARAAQNLRDAGKWIQRHDEAIYNTTYWFPMSQIVAEGAPEVRFTQSDHAHYTLFLEKPQVVDGYVVIPAPVPVLDGDTVSLLGVEGGESLAYVISEVDGHKELAIEVPSDLIEHEDYCWVFKVEYIV
ncbi:alpha-L-fucosidase [Stachybotrys elegans]|uniref:alpha-L-fucosidase n=1 Tax=Stachybotrys elegans TaxID=80388 RepID=A0A8K0SDT3_9HYPO|nr:alpha-L-fucosidase [Stachybotrys elegans]